MNEKARIENVHPIAASVIMHLDENGGPSAILDESDLDDIRSGLAELFGDDELREAVRCLLNLGASLEAKGARRLSAVLLDLLAEPELLSALDQLNAHREQTLERGARRFAGFIEKVAPKLGSKPPKEALSLDTLAFARRM